MTFQHHVIFTAVIVTFLTLFVAVFKSVLLPFVLGIVIAYMLRPTVKMLTCARINIAVASAVIVVAFYALVVGVLAVISPVLYREALGFVDNLPFYLQDLQEIVTPYAQKFEVLLGAAQTETFLENNAGKAAVFGKSVLERAAAGSIAVFDILSLALITPIVAYFMMKEWDKITNWVEELLPRHMKETIKDILKQIDAKLSGFIRGQILVALVLAIFYALALSLADLQYGFAIGLVAGLLSIVPMLGTVVGFASAILVAAFQSGWAISYIGLIAGIFILGQLIESYVLTPRLVGKSVGLHPLWIFFALMAGGSLFGIVGMLIAVPIAAIISVLAAFAIKRYKDSTYYKTESGSQKKSPKK